MIDELLRGPLVRLGELAAALGNSCVPASKARRCVATAAIREQLARAKRLGGTLHITAPEEEGSDYAEVHILYDDGRGWFLRRVALSHPYPYPPTCPGP